MARDDPGSGGLVHPKPPGELAKRRPRPLQDVHEHPETLGVQTVCPQAADHGLVDAAACRSDDAGERLLLRQ